MWLNVNMLLIIIWIIDINTVTISFLILLEIPVEKMDVFDLFWSFSRRLQGLLKMSDKKIFGVNHRP